MIKAFKPFTSIFGKSQDKNDRPDLPWVLEQSEKEHDLTHLNWQAIYTKAASDFAQHDQHQLWENIAHTWLAALQSDLGDDYSISEASNFMLLSCEEPHFNKTLLNYLERCRRRILHFLKSIASDEGFGKYVVIVFENNDRYYDYVSHFYSQDGIFGMSSGMFLNRGYGHFVLPHQEIDVAEPVVAHELTHAMLSHLSLPLWLDEGLAVNMEAVLTDSGSPWLARDSHARHKAFWNEDNIQEFWSGESFSRPDEGQQLSYELARTLVTNLSRNMDEFVHYCNQAAWQNGGEKAIENVYGLSLGDMLGNFLGEGNWKPNPNLFSTNQ